VELGLSLAVSPRCDPAQAKWLLGGALLMELAAVPLPSFGFFSLATPFYLALLVQPQLGLLPVALVAPAAALVRALLSRQPLASWLAATTPLLTAGLTMLGLHELKLSAPLTALFGVQVYWLASWQVPRLLAEAVLSGPELDFWARVQARAVPLTGGLICAGLLAAAYEGTPWGWLLLCGVLLALRGAFYAAVVRVEALERDTLQSGLSRAEKQRDRALEEEGRTRQELALKLNQVVVLEELSRALASNPEPAQIMDYILKLAGATLPCETLAIFSPDGPHLQPRRFVSPHAERLASARLLGLSEPVVLQAWSSGLPQTAARGGERLLPGETALAVPLGRLGVLYLGDSRRPGFTAEEAQQLRTLAVQGTVCLQCAEYFSRLQVSLHEYARANDELARAFRLLQDSQAQLVQAGKMAAVGQLAAGVAHELNSPLGAIVLGVEGALDLIDGRPERAKERLGSAWRSACRAQDIVAKLLFYAREGTQGTHALNLKQVVEDSLELVSHQLSLDKVKIVRELAEVPAAEGNLSEIQQVIINLVLNARDAVLEPGAQAPEITLTTLLEGDRVCLVVRDRGPGIPAEIQERIFEPFFTTKPVGRGTGLGLSLSLQIVRQHGGELSVIAGPGAGAAFRLSLPVAKRPLPMVE